MDLRLRLTAYLSLLSVALLALALAATAVSAYRDVGNEIAASTRLAELMLLVGEAHEQSGDDLRRRLAEGAPLRHVALTLESSDAPTPPEPASGFLAALFSRQIDAVRTHRIRVGDATLAIRPDPSAEIEEIVDDALTQLFTLLAFSIGTIAIAWFAAHRALRPVRVLEDSLAQLAQGDAKPVLPKFELREFARIAEAIERLSVRLAESRAREKRLAQRLLELQESERRELARELHDEFGQSLTAIGVYAAFVERHASSATPQAIAECAIDIRREAARVSEHVRGLLAQLRPHGIETLGILDALRDLLAGWCQRAPAIVVDSELPAALPPLAPLAGLTLYRTLQETLTNVLRHSGADHVRVALAATAQEVTLLVADNGSGRAEAILEMSGGGIQGMLERAAMAGGTLRFADGAAGGLCVELTLPALPTLPATPPGTDDGNREDDPPAAA